MRAEERVRLLRAAGHEIGMSLCIVLLADGIERAREVRVTLQLSDGLDVDVVSLIPVDSNVEDELNDCLDALMAAEARITRDDVSRNVSTWNG